MTAYLDVLDETQLHRDQELSRYTGEPLATIRKKTVGAPSSIQLFKDEDCTADSCDFIYEAFPYIDDQTHLLRTLTAYIVTRRAHYMRGLLQHLTSDAESGATASTLPTTGPAWTSWTWTVPFVSTPSGEWPKGGSQARSCSPRISPTNPYMTPWCVWMSWSTWRTPSRPSEPSPKPCGLGLSWRWRSARW